MIYSIVLTPEEAYYGCYKTINYRGSLADVEFMPGSREGTVQVSFKGEIICIETIIASSDHSPAGPGCDRNFFRPRDHSPGL